MVFQSGAWVDYSQAADISWRLRADRLGNLTNEQVQLALTRAVLDELRTLTRILNCKNFLSVPEILRGIKKNTTRPKRKKAAKR